MRYLKIARVLRLMFVLCLIGLIGVGVRHQFEHRQALDHALVAAIRDRRDAEAIGLIRQGASPNAFLEIGERQSLFQQFLLRLRGQPMKPRIVSHALFLALNRDKRSYETEGPGPRAPDCRPLLETMLEHGADVNVRGPDEEPLLNPAAELHTTATVRLLVEHGAAVNGSDAEGRTPLMRAAGWGDAECVRLLLDHRADVRTVDYSNETALLYACVYGENASVILLVAHHARVNVVDATKRTPLSCLAGRVQSAVTMRLLMDHGAAVDSCDMDGMTPLIHAAGWGDAEGVGLLLDRGAIVDTSDNTGTTALMQASNCGNDASVRLLLERHARVNAVDKDGNTALSHALEGEQDASYMNDAASVRKYRHILKMLRAAGAKN